MALGSTQPLTEMSTRNLPGGKERRAREADNLTAIYEPIVYEKCGSLDVSQPYGSSWPLTGTALPLLTVNFSIYYTVRIHRSLNYSVRLR
jgi:hypothetical protein